MKERTGMMSKWRMNSKGMTLIEILIVVTIIGIVMTVVGAGVMKKFRQARGQTSRLAMQQIASAITAYQLEKGKIPAGGEGLNSLVPDYLDSEKNLQDAWGHDFHYEVPGPKGQSFDIISDGPDEQQGTDDDIRLSDTK